jgi:hypothetical protein
MVYSLADFIRFNLRMGLRFEGSIAQQYLMQVGVPLNDHPYPDDKTSPEIDYDLLVEIVRGRVRRRNEGDVFAIHARVGDIVHLAPKVDVFTDIVVSRNWVGKKCVIYHGNHTGHRAAESADYLDNLKSGIEGIGVEECELRSGEVDEDFVEIATSKHLIAGYRGFGWLSACINPNEVAWDIQEPPVFPWLGDYRGHRQSYLKQLQDGFRYYEKKRKAQSPKDTSPRWENAVTV